MPSFKPTATELGKIAALLDSDDPDMTVDAMTAKVVAASWELFEKKAKFAVIGQVFRDGGRVISPDDQTADRVVLWPYATRTQALNAARELVGSLSSRYMYRTWIAPIHNGTPNSVHRQRMAEFNAPDDARARLNAEQYTGGTCLEVEIDFDGVRLWQCRREPGHDGSHGLWSYNIVGTGGEDHGGQ